MVLRAMMPVCPLESDSHFPTSKPVEIRSKANVGISPTYSVRFSLMSNCEVKSPILVMLVVHLCSVFVLHTLEAGTNADTVSGPVGRLSYYSGLVMQDFLSIYLWFLLGGIYISFVFTSL